MIDDAQAHALVVDGQDAPTANTRTVHDPATGEPLAEVADATAADAERAVAAARAAFRRGDWSRATPADPYTLTTADGQPILLQPGRTFVEIVDGANYELSDDAA